MENLHVDALEKYHWLVSLPSLIGFALMGMLMHFMKKNIKGETLTDIRNYFKDNFKSTFVAFVATVVGTLGLYFTLSTGQVLDVISAFGCGYTFDSLFNKWDKG
jgi:hypothetical protein